MACGGAPARGATLPWQFRGCCGGGPGSGEAGQELLEFGFAVAILMMLMLGLVVFARGYNIYQTMTRAAREGARMAVLPTCAGCLGNASDDNQVIDPTGECGSKSTPIFNNYIAPALQASGLNPNLVPSSSYCETVNWLNSTDADYQCGVIISFQYPYSVAIPFTTTNLTNISLSTEVRMRMENQTVSSSGGVTVRTCGGHPAPSP